MSNDKVTEKIEDSCMMHTIFQEERQESLVCTRVENIINK